ncbi:hypothetical protein CLV98_10678 [Dyadobacter jejuensis]|uniref:Ubiquitin-like domain-containing protein n=1 Tax=Dyadobacter jejuensis TaxID=1082580 RepID=A0A316B4Q9_9BACT|nr:hypothetical protein [Dyadobacter jejuensis]PWJ57607.1 hypothetical protein CLV98_10678 [Dyadobacter jejuensis]
MDFSINELFNKNEPLAWVLGVLGVMVILLLSSKIIKPIGEDLGVKLLITLIVSVVVVYIASLYFKNTSSPTQDPPSPPTKSTLTLIFHELGNREMRPFDDQGRVLLSDSADHLVAKSIGKYGIVRFDPVENWLLHRKTPILVRLKNIDTTAYTYVLEDPLLDGIAPNDTIEIPVRKIPKTTSNPLAGTSNNIRLLYYNNKKQSAVPVNFQKDKTIQELKEVLITKYIPQGELKYMDRVGLAYRSMSNILDNEQQTLAEVGMNDGEKVFLSIISMVVYSKKSDDFQLDISNGNFKNPVVKIDNKTLPFTRDKGKLSVQIPMTDTAYTVTVRDGSKYYSQRVRTKDSSKIDISASKMSQINMSSWPIKRSGAANPESKEQKK